VTEDSARKKPYVVAFPPARSEAPFFTASSTWKEGTTEF
jgi:hypothetical protein